MKDIKCEQLCDKFLLNCLSNLVTDQQEPAISGAKGRGAMLFAIPIAGYWERIVDCGIKIQNLRS